MTFRAEDKVKEINLILYKKKRGRFRKAELWDQVAIPIPSSIEPSHLPFCTIMDVSYSIQVAIQLIQSIWHETNAIKSFQQLIVNPGRFYKKLKLRSNVLIEKPPDINSTHSLLCKCRVLWF